MQEKSQTQNQTAGKRAYDATASASLFFSEENEPCGESFSRHVEGRPPDSWSELHALSKLYRLLHGGSADATGGPPPDCRDDLDESSRLLLRRLLDEATQQALRSSLNASCASASTSVPFFLERETRKPIPSPLPPETSTGSRESRGRPSQRLTTTESRPVRRVNRPLSGPSHAPVRLPHRPPVDTAPSSGSTQSKPKLRSLEQPNFVEPPKNRREISHVAEPHKHFAAPSRTQRSSLSPPIRRLNSTRRRGPMRRLGSSGTSCGSGSSVDPRKNTDPRAAASSSARTKETEKKKTEKRCKEKEPEEKKKSGRLKRMKKRLGLIFFHHHHHHHHHHHESDSGGHRDQRAERRQRRHRSFRELLRSLVHHSAWKRSAAAAALPPPARPKRQPGYVHSAVEGLLRHVLRRRRRKEKPRLPEPGKKKHWWQKLRRRRRGVRLAGRKKSSLRLGLDRRSKKPSLATTHRIKKLK